MPRSGYTRSLRLDVHTRGRSSPENRPFLPLIGNRAIASRRFKTESRGPSGFTETPFPLQASLQPARHGGQWPLIWRRRTTSRGYKERQDSPDFHPVPRASCHPTPPLYLIPRPSRPTSPVSVSNNDRRYRVARRETSAFVRAFNPSIGLSKRDNVAVFPPPPPVSLSLSLSLSRNKERTATSFSTLFASSGEEEREGSFTGLAVTSSAIKAIAKFIPVESESDVTFMRPFRRLIAAPVRHFVSGLYRGEFQLSFLYPLFRFCA